MATELKINEISARIQEASLKRGLRSAKELFEAMKALAYDVKLGGIRKHWERKFVPSTPYVAAYCDYFKVSADWLLTGQEPPKPTIAQLKEIVGEMISVQGGGIPEMDPVTLEIDKLLSRLKSVDSKQQVLRMIKGYVELEERGE